MEQSDDVLTKLQATARLEYFLNKAYEFKKVSSFANKDFNNDDLEFNWKFRQQQQQVEQQQYFQSQYYQTNKGLSQLQITSLPPPSVSVLPTLTSASSLSSSSITTTTKTMVSPRQECQQPNAPQNQQQYQYPHIFKNSFYLSTYMQHDNNLNNYYHSQQQRNQQPQRHLSQQTQQQQQEERQKRQQLLQQNHLKLCDFSNTNDSGSLAMMQQDLQQKLKQQQQQQHNKSFLNFDDHCYQNFNFYPKIKQNFNTSHSNQHSTLTTLTSSLNNNNNNKLKSSQHYNHNHNQQLLQKQQNQLQQYHQQHEQHAQDTKHEKHEQHERHQTKLIQMRNQKSMKLNTSSSSSSSSLSSLNLLYYNPTPPYHQIEHSKEQQQQLQHHDDEINLTKHQQQQQLQQQQQHQDTNSNNIVDSLQKDVQKLTTNNISPKLIHKMPTATESTNATITPPYCNNNQTTNAYTVATSESLKQKTQQSQQLQQHQQQHKMQGDSNSHEVIISSPKNDHNNQHHQHHQHQHQYGSNSTIHFKSCLCFGESVCSGIEVDIENNNNSNHFHHGETTYHMKILVPAVASGAIIGKGGETIATLQKDTGARVKMSKSHDFYPGTTERVCLITGSVEGIMIVLDFIMDKIREKPDLTTKLIDSDSKQQDRDKQVKILVPNSTAGMIIGKAGSYIKQIKEESGSYVQISQKPKDISLQERCITIIGDKENNKNACKMILAKIVEDPQSGTCLNVSYADVNGPVANFNPTGSPYATNQNAINSSTASLNSNLGTAISGTAAASGLLLNGAGINLSVNLGSPNPAPNLAVATQVLEHIKMAMRGSGYSEAATTEICTALGSLAKYGVLGIGVGVSHAANGGHPQLSNYLGVSALEQNAAQAASAAASNVFGAVGQVNLEQYAAAAAVAAAASRPSQLDAAQFDPFRHLGTAAAAQSTTPASLNNNSFGLTAGTGSSSTAQQALNAVSAAHSLTAAGLSKSPTPGDLSAKDSKNVEIPEVIVGAILGPNGRSLVEIQHSSGASVQISKKGIFAPGTRNRIVTITGPPSAIAKAQYLIEQKINEEETKRARQIPLTTVNC